MPELSRAFLIAAAQTSGLDNLISLVNQNYSSASIRYLIN